VDNYYLPGIRVIRDHGILQDFPGRTETDLYLWLRKHQSELEDSLNQQITDHDAAHDLSERFGQRLWQKINRFFSNLVKRD
jgi:hypothetical protein